MKAVHLSLLPLAYAGALRFWSYPILLILRSAPGAPTSDCSRSAARSRAA